MRGEAQYLKVGDVASISAGNSAPQKKELFENGTYPFVRTSDVGQIRIGSIDTSADKLNNKGIQKLKLYPKGTILIPKSGASTFLNHRVILATDAYVSSHLATIIADRKKILDRYLLYFLITVKAQDLIQDHAYPSLKLSDIQSIPVFVPSLSEQKRIVAMLDEAFAGIDQAITNTEKNLTSARELFDSTLNTIFAQKGEEHPKVALGQVCGLQNGFVFKSQLFKPQGIPVLRISSIQNEEVCNNRPVYADPKDYKEDLSRYIVDEGKLLIAMSGATTGKVGFNNTGQKFFLNQRVGMFKPSEKINIYYLFYYLLTKVEENLEIAAGAAQPNLSTKQIKEFQIPLPPKDEQENIVKKLGMLRNETQNLEAIYKQKLASLNELKQSLLQKAFSGELTANSETLAEAAE